ncbi:hypothetical protein PV325_004985 [Microctonus aethiopoides]|nr:hypothetical protein PV325_004985 [Microctonus aethiopoides]
MYKTAVCVKWKMDSENVYATRANSKSEIGEDTRGTPTGLEDVSKYPELFAELLAKGWIERDIQKLAGLNLIRVFKAVEQVRDQMAAEGMEPLEEEIPNEDIIGRDYCRLKQQIGAP